MDLPSYNEWVFFFYPFTGIHHFIWGNFIFGELGKFHLQFIEIWEGKINWKTCFQIYFRQPLTTWTLTSTTMQYYIMSINIIKLWPKKWTNFKKKIRIVSPRSEFFCEINSNLINLKTYKCTVSKSKFPSKYILSI